MKHIIFRISIAVLSGIIVLIVFTTLTIFLGIANTDNILMDQLDNPHINGGYKNWKSQSISQDYIFKIPGDWDFQKTNTYHTITDREGFIGICIATTNNNSDEISHVLSNLIDAEIIKIEQEFFPEIISIGQAYFCQLTIQSETELIKYYQVALYNSTAGSCSLLFPVDVYTNFDELSEFAEAIMYSYSFP